MSIPQFRTLSIIIPNYNGEALLPQFLPSVFRALQHHTAPYEVIIIDDCSKDNSALVMKEIAASYPKVKLYFNETNKGFSETCNVGIGAAQYDIMFILNNDVELTEDYFNYYAAHFEDEAVFAITTCGYYFTSREPLDGIKVGKWKRGLPRVTENIFNTQIEHSKVNPPYLSFGVQGAYFFADSKKVKELGGFDDLYSPYIYEETDLGYKAMKRGWKIYYEPRCVGYHQVSASIKKVSNNFAKDVISNRNRIIFVWKNIHSTSMLLSHFFFMLLKVISFNKVYIEALKQAYKLRKAINTKRKVEMEAAVITDKQLFNFLSKYHQQFSK